MFSQRDALIRLLRDDDPATIDLIKEQLAMGGTATLGDLRDLREVLAADDEKVSAHVSDIIAGIEQAQTTAEFAEFCRNFGPEDTIEEAAFLLASAMLPGFDAAPYRRKLDAWGRQFTLLLEKAISDRERVEVLARFFGEQLNFRGNTADYYNPRNSLLSSVMDTRMGIPITLSLLYRLVARRAGMQLEGVNLPGHFIARYREVFFDPFHQGKILSLADCREILARQDVEIEAIHFAAPSDRDILARILANLVFIYERNGDFEMQSRVIGWMAALDSKPGTSFSA